MSNFEWNKRIDKAVREHYEILNKELAYSEDLQKKEKIAELRSNILRVEAMRR